MISFGSLFAGIGGFDLGLERVGMTCQWQVELDKYATQVLEKNWPQVHREKDICECGKHNLEPVDVICGGFPCQDISCAGKGAGLEGSRSGLFFEALRLVRELEPSIIVLENVSALLGRGLDAVLGSLAEIGYDAEWHCIPAAAVGAPHIRDRIFIIGSRNRDADGGDVDPKCEGGKQNSKSKRDGDGEPSISRRAREISNPLRTILKSRSRRWRIRESDSSDIENFWTTEPDVGRVADGIPKRMDRLRGLGNAIVPQVAEVVGEIIIERLKEMK